VRSRPDRLHLIERQKLGLPLPDPSPDEDLSNGSGDVSEHAASTAGDPHGYGAPPTMRAARFAGSGAGGGPGGGGPSGGSGGKPPYGGLGSCTRSAEVNYPASHRTRVFSA
jgi:hypothetical protein